MDTDLTSPHDRRVITRGLALMARYVRTHPGTFAISVTGSVVFAVASVAFTVVLGRLTDDVIIPSFDPASSADDTALVLLAVVAVAAIRSAGVVVRRFFAGLTMFRLRTDLQNAMADQYLAMPPAVVAATPRGELLARADTDVEVAVDALSPLPFTIGVLTMVGVGVVSLLLVDFYLFLVICGLVPTLTVLNRLYARLQVNPALAVRESMAAMSAVASESFDGAIVVKTLGRADAELERFSQRADDLRHHTVRLLRIRAVFESMTAAIPELSVVILVLVGGWRIGAGAITPGELVQAVALFGVLAFPIHVIGFFFGDLAPAVVASERIDDMLARPREARQGTRTLPRGPLGVSVRDLTIHRNGVAAVDGLDLEVAPGEVVAIVGSTGSGKSTVLEAIVGLVAPDTGRIDIGGVELRDIAPAALNDRVALAFQEPYLLGDRADENVRFGAAFDGDGFAAAVELAQVAGTIEQLPHREATVIGERGVTLSGGQRQRLALARAVARRPGLLLLDDATSAVDPAVEQAILANLRTLRTTVVLVAHRRSTIALADRVVFMSAGRIVAEGSHDQLLVTEPAYRNLLQAYDAAEHVEDSR